MTNKELINYFNQFKYGDDVENWSNKDWAEFLAYHLDCDDCPIQEDCDCNNCKVDILNWIEG